MAAGSGRRTVSRRRRAGVPDTADSAVTAGAAAAGGGFRYGLYEYAGGSDQLRDTRRVAQASGGHEWIVLTWAAGARPPPRGHFQVVCRRLAYALGSTSTDR
jgi:hypothetical protein